MIEDLSQIRILRRRYGLSQKELANASGVSQSLIAKIERGDLEPSFSKAKAIFCALEELHGKHEKKAEDLMNRNILFCSKKDKILDVVAIMKKKGISQVPVRENSRVLGILSERSVLEAISNFGSAIASKTVQEVIEECPPIVTVNTGQRMILEMLKEYPIVLVSKNGEIVGLVSKADMLNVF